MYLWLDWTYKNRKLLSVETILQNLIDNMIGIIFLFADIFYNWKPTFSSLLCADFEKIYRHTYVHVLRMFYILLLFKISKKYLAKVHVGLYSHKERDIIMKRNVNQWKIRKSILTNQLLPWKYSFCNTGKFYPNCKKWPNWAVITNLGVLIV